MQHSTNNSDKPTITDQEAAVVQHSDDVTTEYMDLNSHAAIIGDESMSYENNSFEQYCKDPTADSTSTPISKKPAKNILQIDIENAELPLEKRDKTEFHYQDIDSATLSWQSPSRSTPNIYNAGNQEKLIFELHGTTSTLKFTNTCGYDSIFESLKHFYQSNAVFRNQIESAESKNATFVALINYIQSNNLNAFYLHRAKFMFIRVPTVINSYFGPTKDCRVNLCSLFKDVMTDFPSITMTGTCTECGGIQERKDYAVEIDYVQFFNEGVTKLAEILQNALIARRMYCAKCKQKISTRNMSLGNYIAYDLELIHETIHEKMMSGILGRNIKNVETNLLAVPQSIKIFNKCYSLQAAIQFVELSKSLLHYVAYCKSSTEIGDKWLKYDDMTGVAKSVQLKNLSPMKIGILLYAISENEART